jgi:hypothetical protein
MTRYCGGHALLILALVAAGPLANVASAYELLASLDGHFDRFYDYNDERFFPDGVFARTYPTGGDPGVNFYFLNNPSISTTEDEDNLLTSFTFDPGISGLSSWAYGELWPTLAEKGSLWVEISATGEHPHILLGYTPTEPIVAAAFTLTGMEAIPELQGGRWFNTEYTIDFTLDLYGAAPEPPTAVLWLYMSCLVCLTRWAGSFRQTAQ